jgi:hypothetical protein
MWTVSLSEYFNGRLHSYSSCALVCCDTLRLHTTYKTKGSYKGLEMANPRPKDLSEPLRCTTPPVIQNDSHGAGKMPKELHL